ncbi:hypothetical protein BDK51DRAFT_27474 [Blyttiomyces helicus]|uniref:Uncharacterized protein n=1 Tax=Blyttiomyces helicus TaxID=388810 RepID=A0A4P9W962_9FUNG|nr:hypothetical protein BDK51DRAFT_27474 [Blyttiomyces helicus]|eukprot:RKO88692.1 hypothetical protein BDK51DRAFT_27474 [Blyttiomyces helicus]
MGDNEARGDRGIFSRKPSERGDPGRQGEMGEGDKESQGDGMSPSMESKKQRETATAPSPGSPRRKRRFRRGETPGGLEVAWNERAKMGDKATAPPTHPGYPPIYRAIALASNSRPRGYRPQENAY